MSQTEPTACKFIESLGLPLAHGLAVEPERMTLWVQSSYRTFGDRDDPHLIYQLQQCGTLDVLLIAVENENRRGPPVQPSDLFMAGYSLCSIYCDSWIILTYEVLRTFRNTSKFRHLTTSQETALTRIFRLVELVRMPLVKHEAAKTRGLFHTPQRFLHIASGSFGWKVWDQKLSTHREIVRRRLADAILNFGQEDFDPQQIDAIECSEGNRYAQFIIKVK